MTGHLVYDTRLLWPGLHSNLELYLETFAMRPPLYSILRPLLHHH